MIFGWTIGYLGVFVDSAILDLSLVIVRSVSIFVALEFLCYTIRLSKKTECHKAGHSLVWLAYSLNIWEKYWDLKVFQIGRVLTTRWLKYNHFWQGSQKFMTLSGGFWKDIKPLLEEDSGLFSSGQGQRLSIARFFWTMLLFLFFIRWRVMFVQLMDHSFKMPEQNFSKVKPFLLLFII